MVFCQYFKQCGGCIYQDLELNDYYQLKENFILTSLNQNGFKLDQITIVKTTQNQRRRCHFKVEDNQICLTKLHSNQLVKIENCPILEQKINNLIPKINQFLREINDSKITDIFINKIDENIEVIFENSSSKQEIQQFLVQNNLKNGNLEAKINDFTLKLPKKCFIQATKLASDFFNQIIIKNTQKNDKILDLFSGSGFYAFNLAKIADKIDCYEVDKSSTSSITKSAKINHLSNKIKSFERNLFTNPLDFRIIDEFDLAIINPPRLGAVSQIKQLSKSNIKTIIAIYCDVKNFARDTKILLENNFYINEIYAIDQFYMTKHIEIIAVFRK